MRSYKVACIVYISTVSPICSKAITFRKNPPLGMPTKMVESTIVGTG